MAGRSGGTVEPDGHPSLLTRVVRVDVANRLEMSLRQGWEALAEYETRLIQDDTVPEGSRALDSKRQELVVSLGTGASGAFLSRCPQPASSEQMRTEAPSLRAGSPQVLKGCGVPSQKLRLESCGRNPSYSWDLRGLWKSGASICIICPDFQDLWESRSSLRGPHALGVRGSPHPQRLLYLHSCHGATSHVCPPDS